MIANMQVESREKEHIWIDGKQYISFDRVCDIRSELNEDVRIMNKKIQELTDENNALKVLLKEQLVKEGAE